MHHLPVSLEKPGLEYNEEENAITPINRDWIVGNPNVAFIYPAFIDRSADRDRVMYYTKDAICTHKEIMKDILNCKVEYTHSEILKELEETIQGVTEEREKTEEYMQNICSSHFSTGFRKQRERSRYGSEHIRHDIKTCRHTGSIQKTDRGKTQKKSGEKIIKKSHYIRIQSGLRSSTRGSEEIKQRVLWQEQQRNY